MREWTDMQTGRTVRQLTDWPAGATVAPFRRPKHLPDGCLLAHQGGPSGGEIAIDPESGDVRRLELPGRLLRLGACTDRTYCLDAERNVWMAPLPDGEPILLGRAPRVSRYTIEVDITEDGRTLVMGERIHDLRQHPTPSDWDAPRLMQWFARPRSGNIWAYDLQQDRLKRILHLDDVCPIHIDPSPADPRLVKFSHDHYDAYCQRIWTIRTDGSDLRPIRPQERGEFVTHEFWWPDGHYIAYKYQDRRGDPTIEQLPWGEYSPVPTQIGLADLSGKEVYLSDPINHYHSHVFVSRDGGLLCGEGTDGHGFVYVATFSMQSSRIEFTPLATVHTPYRPFSIGQHVNAGFSQDNRWLVYNDTIAGRLQVCAVRAEL